MVEASEGPPGLEIRMLPLLGEENGLFELLETIASRRLHWNFGLERAVEWSRETGVPLLIRDGRSLPGAHGGENLEWSESPLMALKVTIELNNRYPVDGRDPNSHSGIFWCLGRHGRAWGPERPIFGKVRYMSSENRARKLHVDGYLQRWGTR